MASGARRLAGSVAYHRKQRDRVDQRHREANAAPLACDGGGRF